MFQDYSDARYLLELNAGSFGLTVEGEEVQGVDLGSEEMLFVTEWMSGARFEGEEIEGVVKRGI